MDETRTTIPAGEPGASFNERLNRAREIVQLLEQGEVDLETGARLYREGCEALAFCRRRLASVRNEIEHLDREVEQAADFLKRDGQQGA